MTFGLLVSVMLHAGLLAWALLNFHATPPLKLPDEIPVEVSIISQIDLETRQKKGDSLSKIEEAAMSAGKAPSPKDAQKPKPVRAVEPPAASEPSPPEPPKPPEPVKEEPPPLPKPDQIAALIEKAPTPTPPPEPEGPSLEEKQKLEEKIAEQQRQDDAKKAAEEAKKKADAEAKKKADAEAKKKADDLAKKKLAEDKKKKEDAAKKAAELAKNKFDPNKIAQSIENAPDQLNKVKEQPSAAQGAEAPPSKPTTAKGPTAGTRAGTSNVNTARAKDMLEGQLRAAFRQCWNKPLAGGGVVAPVVTLRWSLNQDGTLRSDVKLVQPRGDDPVTQAAIRAAQSAVQKCVPFQLPPELYEMWREIDWFFDPQQE
ncbi:MAG: cell envelope integrity protein TolA [Hyphomicrobiaceae bacterium]